MSETPIYDQAFEEAFDRIVEAGGDEQMLDDLQRMDDETRPGNPVLAEAARMVGS